MTLEQQLAAWTERVDYLADAWIRGSATEEELDAAIEKKRAVEDALKRMTPPLAANEVADG